MNTGSVPTGYMTGVTARLRAQPEMVIQAALATLAHWRARGQTAPYYLERWGKLLHAAREGGAGETEKLFQVLEGDDEESARMRDFHPFAGILTREERRVLRGTCAYKH